MAKPIDKATDIEMEQFQNDLLESVRQMKTGKAARTTVVVLTPLRNQPCSMCAGPIDRGTWTERRE